MFNIIFNIVYDHVDIVHIGLSLHQGKVVYTLLTGCYVFKQILLCIHILLYAYFVVKRCS